MHIDFSIQMFEWIFSEEGTLLRIKTCHPVSQISSNNTLIKIKVDNSDNACMESVWIHFAETSLFPYKNSSVADQEGIPRVPWNPLSRIS